MPFYSLNYNFNSHSFLFEFHKLYDRICNKKNFKFLPENKGFFGFIIFFAVLIAPAVLNNFPFYFEDSASYVGRFEKISTSRSAVPGLLSYPLYKFIGPWALPLINSFVTALVFCRFISTFNLEKNYLIIIIGLIATSLWILTSLITPDIWAFVLLICILLLIKRWSWIDFIIASFALSGHGSNLFWVVMLLPAAFLCFKTPKKVIRVFVPILLFGCIIIMTSNRFVSGKYFPINLAGSILASKLLNDVPKSLESLCTDQPSKPICERRHLIETTDVKRSDDFYIWASKIGKPKEGGLTREQFNAAGKDLFIYSLTKFPKELIKQTFDDFMEFYIPTSWALESSLTKDPNKVGWADWLTDLDTGVLAPRGFFKNNEYRALSLLLNTLSLLIALVLMLITWKQLTVQYREMIIFMWLALIANDFIFALISGHYTRYHVRLLGCVILITLLCLDCRRKKISKNLLVLS